MIKVVKKTSYKKAKKAHRGGFTLVETMVSIFIFSLIVGSIAAASVTSINTLRVIHEKTVASYLAQEAMEYVKNVRDTETRNPSGTWYGAPLTDCLEDNNPSNEEVCIIDTRVNDPYVAIDQCGSSGCPHLRYNGSTGVYSHSGGEVTPYVREVRLIHPDPITPSNTNGTGDDEILVQVEVRWRSGTQDRKITLYHSIFNWQ